LPVSGGNALRLGFAFYLHLLHCWLIVFFEFLKSCQNKILANLVTWWIASFIGWWWCPDSLTPTIDCTQIGDENRDCSVKPGRAQRQGDFEDNINIGVNPIS
jgi:hypothetical protein